MQKPIILGDKAKIAKEVLGAYMDEVEDNVLLALKDKRANPEKVRLYYTVAIDFENMINNLILKGENKQKSSEKLKQEIEKANKRSDS